VLSSSQFLADTEKVKAATAELRKTYYPHPQSLLWLLQILTSHDVSQIRQQAAVEALRLVPKHWNELPDAQKPAIRAQLLQATLNEDTILVRHSAARVVSAIARIDLEDGEWADLPAQLAKAAKSPEVKHREVGVYILFTLLEAAGDGFTDKLPNLFALFRDTIQDPESQDVRINTMMALSRVAMLIEPDEDPQSLAAFQEAFPAMVAVLKTAVDEGNEDRTMQAFEVFQTLLGCESALMAKHFKDLVQFMVDLAAEANLADESRSQALSFLMQCVKYRRMKIQGIKDMGEQLTTKSMQIVAEMSSEDDEDEITPARSALGLLDLLATSLPPRQVIVPLLKALPHYVNSDSPAFRKAGILALGMCVEGAPDFIATQLSDIMPVVIRLLHDSDVQVRQAALHGVTRLADDLAEDMSKEHAQLVPALLKNLDSATAAPANDADQKRAIKMIVAACTALESLIDGMDVETIGLYAPNLVPILGRLFSHPDYNVKASAAGAMGSIAGSAEEQFLPYFEPTMKALSEYIGIKDSEDELVLRAAVTDTMGRMASAVGAQAFQPYVQHLMQASEEALHLGNPRLRETSYILWSTMAKIYEEEFTPFLDGVVKGLMESLEQEESDLEVELGEEASDLVGKEVVVAGKKVKVTAATDEIEDLDAMEDDDDDDDWDDLTAVTAVALEKEISVEVIGDILTHTRQKFLPYLEKTVETIVGMVEHSYEGVRKAAVSTLWRAYACLWELMEQHSGEKWQAGIPLKQQPSQELVKLGEVVATATMQVWGDEVDRYVEGYFRQKFSYIRLK
jgi:importin-4